MERRQLKEVVILTIIFFISAFVRLISLDQIPAGLYVDEASLGYNAFSILQTGKDEYGMSFPIFLRSFAVFTPPLYSYLSIIPIALLGFNIFSVRLLSALSGIALVYLTYLIIKRSSVKHASYLALLSALIVALSPWAIFQSRTAQQANFGLTLFIFSIFLFILSIRKIIYFIPASIILALSAYTYHAERVLSFVFLIIITITFRRYFTRFRKTVFLGIFVFFLISLPQLLLLYTPGSLQRYNTQGYTQNKVFENYGGNFRNIPVIGRGLYIVNKFSAQYISSYSPRNLFFEPESQTFRSMPTMAVFYFWMIIPFFWGIKYFYRERKDDVIKLVSLCIIFGSLPAALTGDPFYTLRMLPTIWGLGIVISFGLLNIIQKLHSKIIMYGTGISLVIISVLMIYISYFIIFRSERSYAFGYPFLEFAKISEKNKEQKYVLDAEIYDAPYILLASYKSFDPVQLQKQTNLETLTNYYTDINFNKYRTIGNIDIRNVKWGKDQCTDEIVVADDAALSEKIAKDHEFTLEFEIKDLLGKTYLRGYRTHPEKIPLSCRFGE